MKRRLVAVGAALVLALGAATVTASPAAAACNLHVVYTLYFWGGAIQRTTYYDVYRYFVDHKMGVASINWVC